MASSNTPVIRPLGTISRAITQIFRQPKDRITGIEQTDAFGPLQPFRPMGGDDAQPFVSQIQPGQNQVYTPRSREPIDSKSLREASMYDLARIIIENVEDQVSRMPINVRLKRKPGETGKDYAKRKPDNGILAVVGHYIEQPNADQCGSQFMRALCEDMLTIDAASVLTRRNAKGGVFDFRAIDGAQIARYFDAWGGTPQPPNPAYAQVWDAGQSGGNGIPWVDLTTDQLNYAMRNLKTYKLYGLSPLEQALTMVRTGTLRLQFQQDYYTAGSIPDAMQIVPSGISTDKLKEAQKVLNAELSGILSKRRQLRLIQGFHEDPSKEQILFPKEALLKDEFDDYVIRCLCFAFGTSPQRLQRVMGMRSGQVNQESAEKEGFEGWLDWGKHCVWDRMISSLGFYPEYESVYEEDADVDPLKQAQIDDINLRNGKVTINEARESDGMQPFQDVAEAEQPIIITATGPVPLSLDAQVAHAKNMAEAMPKPDPKPAPKGNKVLKRAILDPRSDNPARQHARARLERALNHIFERQKEKAASATERLIKKIRKDDDSSSHVADEIYLAIEAEFASLPAEARAALEQAALSGANDAWLQIEITDSDIIGGVHHLAADYASKRAAEMVGMRYDDSGELVANPNAKWAITDTTRDRLREIIKNGFEDQTPISELVTAVREADIFSESRAATIAKTEVRTAQVHSNIEVWKKAGVKTAKWLAHGPDPCVECLMNADVTREIGKEYPSGDKWPLAHPNCYCYLQPIVDE